MKALETGMKVIGSREIALATEKDHHHVLRDIRDMCNQLEAKIISDQVRIEIDNHEVIVLESEYEVDLGMGRKQYRKEYLLNEMAAELLGMNYDAKRRLAVMKLVREMKEMLERQFIVIQNLKKEETKPLSTLTKIATGLKNKVQYKKLGRNKIFEDLRERGILDRKNKPRKDYIDRGYFILQPLKGNKYVSTTMVTVEGEKWLKQMFYPEMVSNASNSINDHDFKMLFANQELIMEALQIHTENLLVSKSGTNLESERVIIKDKLSNVNTKLKLTLGEIKKVKALTA